MYFNFLQFLGECEVDNAKGTDIVKDAIRKRKVGNLGLLLRHVQLIPLL